MIKHAGVSLAWQRLKHQARLQRRWWLKSHCPYQPFFVIATQRSGSCLLLSYLRRHKLAMLGEVLCHVLAIGPRRQRTEPSRALRHIRYSFQAVNAKLRGCKLMLTQLADCGLSLDALDAAFPSAKYVILYRQNLAEQFVSLRMAEATQQFLLFPGQPKRQQQITIDPRELEKYCERTRASYHEFLGGTGLRERSVLLSYEELVADARGWLHDEICPLLDVAFVEPESKLQKQNTLPLSASISNYGEIASLLGHCRQHHQWPSMALEPSPSVGAAGRARDRAQAGPEATLAADCA